MIDQDNFIQIMNQVFEINKKQAANEELGKSIARNLKKINNLFEDMGYLIYNPVGENFDETRVDCDANIMSDKTQDLKITDVIKPIIFRVEDGKNLLLQKGIVIVE